MTVKELIDYLYACNPDYPVLIGGMDEITSITEERHIISPEESHVDIWAG